MELLFVIRPLWRRRYALAPGVLAALVVLVGLHGLSPVKASAGVAWTRVALDTPKSQLVDTAPDGADTLVWRAATLMHGLATDDTRVALARRLGVPVDHVTVVDGSFGTPLVPASMPVRAAEAAGVVVTPYVVTLVIHDYSLPVISLEADGPDPAAAKRLADATVAIMASRGSPGGTYRSQIRTAGPEKLQPFAVAPVAPIRTDTVSTAKPALKPIAASMFLLFAWTVAVLAVPVLRRRLQRRAPVPA